MRLSLLPILLLIPATPSLTQTQTHHTTPAELQTILSLPLAQAVQQRETYKAPLRSAYARQTGPTDKECDTASQQGQQTYNICMGHADEAASQDYAIFYNNLQMLCHTQAELSTLQASEQAWSFYRDRAIKATFTAWSDGTAAPSIAGQTDLVLLRDRMRVLNAIYTLNISQ